ncbi:WxL domain-containing protein [Lapidilactobacillus luobeiensis]|uniref:WxL domain-containing protein n=1 Tax=Lapidilactobacillus luobeiensis TaxID=2950371 RepID=UPI0021C3076C|nr:WxL domain-containing protein [Lapidilactobacillus luobeiensis]
MKKSLSLFGIIAVLGLSLAALSGTRTVLAANPTEANLTDDTQDSATTTASVNFKGGTLSLYSVLDAVSFNTVDDAFSTSVVWANGLETTSGDKDLIATVADLRGGDDDKWNLSVKKGSWVVGDDGVASGATALDTGATLSTDDGEITTDGVVYASAGAGQTVITPKPLKLAIAKGTLVKKGSYTNTLTWTLADGISENQN